MSRLLPKLAEEHQLQGHTEVQGIPVAIENRAGSVREGTTPDGHHWQTKMKYPYGYLVGTKGADDEPVDAYVGPDKDAPDAFVVHQHKPDGTGFDEDKVMLGFQTKEEARKAYLEHYDSDKFLGPISRVSIERLQELVESKEKLTKISYAKDVHFHLMNRTIEEAFGDHITPEARRVMLEQARESDVGLRHPWKPWNAVQHSFPTLSKEELKSETQDRHQEAVGSLAKAIAEKHLSDTHRSVAATSALMGLAQVQHSKVDVHSHFDKPLEIARAEGGPEREQQFLKIREALREHAGAYGGFIASGLEHVRSGVTPKFIGLRSALDKFEPDKWDSDKHTLETAEQYGQKIRESVVSRLKSDYSMKKPEAEEALNAFMKSFSPGVVDRAAAEILDTSQFVKTHVGKLLEKTSDSKPKGIKFLYIDAGGGHRAQAKAMAEAAQARGIPAEAIDWKDHFAKGEALKEFEDTYLEYIQGKKGLPALGLANAKFHLMGTDKEKLRSWVEQNKDHAIVLTMEHLQHHFDDIDHPVHVLHSDPVTWPLSSSDNNPNRIHIGLPAVLDELGVKKNRVEIKNVPVGEGVLHPVGKSGLLSPKKFNVTVSGGAFGAEVVPLTEQVLKSKLPPGTVVHAVAGKNESALKELEGLAKRDPRLKAHGFAPLPTMMREADLNVVRTHGTTFAETVASGKPAVYYGPHAPAGELLHPVTDFQADLTRRTAVYAGEHVGHPVAVGLDKVPDAVNKMLGDPDRYRHLAAVAKRQMGNPADQAVRQIMRARPGYLRPKE